MTSDWPQKSEVFSHIGFKIYEKAKKKIISPENPLLNRQIKRHWPIKPTLKSIEQKKHTYLMRKVCGNPGCLLLIR
jgi:hypothetical protein